MAQFKHNETDEPLQTITPSVGLSALCPGTIETILKNIGV